MSGFRPVPARHNISPSANLPETIPTSLTTCPMVLVRKDGHVPPLAPLYAGPYKVLSRSARTFRLQVGTRTEVVSVQRLKPACTNDEELPALPPRRGRPPRLAPPISSALPPPRRRGRPRKVVTAAITASRRKKSVLFVLTPIIINESLPDA